MCKSATFETEKKSYRINFIVIELTVNLKFIKMMKKLILMLILPLLLMAQTVWAQKDNSDFRFTIKTNPLSAVGGPLYVAFIPITGEYKVLFEAKTTRKQSIETGFGYLGPSLLINIDELSEQDSVSGVKTSGYHLQLIYKFFITDEAPRGFYVGPHVSYASAQIANKNNSEDKFGAAKLNMNILLGYQLITGGGFTLNVYTGFGLKLRDYDIPVESTFDFDYGNRVSPNVALGLSFGIAF